MSASVPTLPPWPEQDFTTFGPVEIKPLAKMQQLVAGFLTRNWTTIPHVTHQDEADVTAAEARRCDWNAANQNARFTLLIPAIKAVAAALRTHPVFNTSLSADGKSLAWKEYIHIGVAVDTPRGLLVPVIRDCDTKSVADISSEIATLSAKARAKGLSMSEMSGASITISSLGHIGGTAFTPIINAPEVAILGLGRLQLRAMPGVDGGLDWRQMLPLSLSYDHRVINGADAARFCRTVADMIDSFIVE